MVRAGRGNFTGEAYAIPLGGDEHIFALKQARDLYKAYQDKISECDGEIEKLLSSYSTVDSDISEALSQPAKPKAKNQPNFDVQKMLIEKSGVDLTRVPGINASTALTVLSEIGFSVDAWETEKHFSSWMGVCPALRFLAERNSQPKRRYVRTKLPLLSV